MAVWASGSEERTKMVQKEEIVGHVSLTTIRAISLYQGGEK